MNCLKKLVFDNFKGLINRTPMIELKLKYNNKPIKIYAKLEYYNLTGSIKDRVALYILKNAYESGMVDSRYTIVEATSGNTGIALCAIGAYLGNKVKIYMPDWMSKERIKLMESFGAEVVLISKEVGGFLGCIKLTEQVYKNEDKIFLPRQFSNEENINCHYRVTAPEILNDLIKINKYPDAFIAGVGTGGTVMGIGRYFKEVNSKVKIYPLEPTNSPTLSTGYKVGKHRIQGISDEFVPNILRLNELDEIIGVDDGDAIIMAQMLSRELGLGVGVSSGANIIGAIEVADKLGEDAVVVTICADDNKKYLSTDLMEKETVKYNYISSKVKLISYRSIT